MAKVYYNRVKNPNSPWTIDMVPERWRDAVQALLDADEK